MLLTILTYTEEASCVYEQKPVALLCIVQWARLMGVAIKVNKKIARTQHLGTLATRKYNKSIEFV